MSAGVGENKKAVAGGGKETAMATLGNRRWRLENLFKCRREGDGMAIPFRLRDEQRVVFDHLIEKPNVPLYIIKSRRLGISTGICNFQSERCVFTSGYRGLIIDQTKDDAVKKMTEMVRFAIKNLPPEILQNYVIDKENDSEFRLHTVREKDTEGSAIEAAISGRGGDISFLHVSELGPIAALDPARAREIRTGAFPAARKGCRVVETTWYGGKSGELWDMVRPILDGDPNADGVVHFFPWHGDPQAVRLEGLVTEEMEDYFRTLAEKVGKTFTQEQKRWYCAERIRLGMWVKREIPSTLDEALSVPMAGSIYGAWLDELRQQRRLHDFPADRTVAAFTFWDIGFSDYGCIWLVQFVGRDILLLDYYSGEGEEASHYANVTKRWEAKHDVVVRRHYLPHDADTRERSSGKSYKDSLIVAGLKSKEITVVPRTPDVWLGINELRALLPRCYIHSTNCGQRFFKKGEVKRAGAETIPSGIDCLDFYRKREGSNGGAIYEEPVHNEYSHGCLAAGSMVATRRGDVPIEAVAIGDEVLTPAGYARVLWSGQTKKTTSLVEIELSDGAKLICTPEHKIFNQYGLTPACAIRTLTGVWTQRHHPSLSILTACGIGFHTAAIMSRLPAKLARNIQICTGRFMRIITARLREAGMCITSMATIWIIARKTWRQSGPSIILAPMQKLAGAGVIQTYANTLCEPRFFAPGWSGRNQKPGKSGTEPSGEKMEILHGRTGVRSQKNVSAVEKYSQPKLITKNFAGDYANSDSVLDSLRRALKNSASAVGRILLIQRTNTNVHTVPPYAKEDTRLRLGSQESEPCGLHRSIKNAKSAGLRLWTKTFSVINSIVPSDVENVIILGAREIEKSSPEAVFDLTVEKHHCYFANGILVSNSSALRTMSEAYRQGMIEGSSLVAREKRTQPVRVLRGAGPESYGGGMKRGPNVIR